MNGNSQPRFTLRKLREKFSQRKVYLHHWPDREIDAVTIKMLKGGDCILVDYIDKSVAYVITSLTNKEVDHIRTCRKNGALSDTSLNELMESMLEKGLLQSPPLKRGQVLSPKNENKLSPLRSSRSSKKSPLMTSSPTTARMVVDLEKIVQASQLHVPIMPTTTLWKWIHHNKQKECKMVPKESSKAEGGSLPGVTNTPSLPATLRATALMSPAIKLSHINQQYATIWHEKGNYMSNIWYQGTTSSSIDSSPSHSSTPLEPTPTPQLSHVLSPLKAAQMKEKPVAAAAATVHSPCPSTTSHSVGKLLQMYSAEPLSRDVDSVGDNRRSSAKQTTTTAPSGISAKKSKRKTCHYCEFCQVRYECILEHLKSAQHQKLAEAPGLYEQIDQVIASLTSIRCAPPSQIEEESTILLTAPEIMSASPTFPAIFESFKDLTPEPTSKMSSYDSCPLIEFNASFLPNPASHGSPEMPILTSHEMKHVAICELIEETAKSETLDVKEEKQPLSQECLHEEEEEEATFSTDPMIMKSPLNHPCSDPPSQDMSWSTTEPMCEPSCEHDHRKIEAPILEMYEHPSCYSCRYTICEYCGRMHMNENSVFCSYTQFHSRAPNAESSVTNEQAASRPSSNHQLSPPSQPSVSTSKSPLPTFYRITKSFKHLSSLPSHQQIVTAPCSPYISRFDPNSTNNASEQDFYRLPLTLTRHRSSKRRRSRSADKRIFSPMPSINTDYSLSPCSVQKRRRVTRNEMNLPSILVSSPSFSQRQAKKDASSRIFIHSHYGQA